MRSSKSRKSIRKCNSVHKFVPSELIHNSEHHERKWFHKHGKENHLCLSDEVMVKLRQYFNALDSRNCEFISSQDLEKPLIVFGLCQNSEEVEKIVKIIDTDFSGVIEFDQFVEIFKAAKNNKKLKSGKSKFQQFAKIITGDMEKQMENRVCIQTSVSQFSRRLIIDFLMKRNEEAMVDGRRVAKQIAMKSDRKDLLPVLNKYK